jgi:small subunit ribosomal protein S3
MNIVEQHFAGLLVEDKKIRDYIQEWKNRPGLRDLVTIARIEIIRTLLEVRVILHSDRPGVLIGRKGERIGVLQTELKNLIKRQVTITIEEIPALHCLGRRLWRGGV